MKKAIIRGYCCDTLPFDFDDELKKVWYFGKWVPLDKIPIDEDSVWIIYDTKLPPKRT